MVLWDLLNTGSCNFIVLYLGSIVTSFTGRVELESELEGDDTFYTRKEEESLMMEMVEKKVKSWKRKNALARNL